MKLLEFIDRLTVWRNRKLNNHQLIIVLSLVIGILSGLAAVVLKNLVHYTFYWISRGFQFEKENFLYLALPLIGITLTVLFLKFFIKKDIGHGISRILYAISKRKGILELHHTYSSMIASTFTVAFGGSVGLEAPIVLTGSAIGSNLGRLFHLNHKSLILLIGCGGAGAIAGIFKSPIAAVVFAIEVLLIDLTLASLIPLLISAVTAAVVAYFLSGKSVLFLFKVTEAFDLTQIPGFILLGIFTGLASLYFTRTTVAIEARFSKVKSQYKKIIVGGVILGVLIFVFPSLFGEGYPMLQEMLSGHSNELVNEGLFHSLGENPWFFLLIVFLVLVFKAVATAVTNGSGGVGGIFAPSLFMGGIAGFFTARVLNLLPFFNLSENNLTLVGMAGMMSGMMHAPLTGIFLIAEITGGYGLLTPLIITATISFLTIRYFEPHSIYAKRLAERGELLTHDKDKAMLTLMKVKNMIETNFSAVHPDDTLGDFVKVVKQSQRNVFPVIDEEKNFYGIIFINDIRKIIFESDLYDSTYLRNLMFMPEITVSPDNTMEEVTNKFSETGNYNLAVLKNGKYLGFVSRATVFSAYRKLLQEFSDE